VITARNDVEHSQEKLPQVLDHLFNQPALRDNSEPGAERRAQDPNETRANPPKCLVITLAWSLPGTGRSRPDRVCRSA